jgi:hypothetical protein
MLALTLLIFAVLSCDIAIPTLPPVVETLIGGGTSAVDIAATNAAGTLTALAAEPTEPPCDTAAVLTIAYIDNGNIWVIEGSNPPLQVTSGGNASYVVISDDGQKIAFATWDGLTQSTELRSVNSDGSGQVLLLSQPNFDALPPPLGGALHHTIHRMQFKPCSQDLLFSTRSVYEGPGLETQNNLIQIDTTTTTMTTLLAPGDGGAAFTISPDGSKIAIQNPERIGFANIDGSGLIPSAHTYTPVITYSEFMWPPPVRWAPDSSAIGLAMPSQDPFDPSAYGSIWTVQADGSGATLSTTITAQFYWTQRIETTISPDLGALCYMRETGTPNVWNLYFASFDGSGEVLYDTADLRQSGWSPDSTNYAYVVDTGSGAELRVGRVGYAPLTLTATSGMLRDIQWVDDMRMLHFAGANPTWNLQLTQLGSGTVTLATITGSSLPTYDFAPKP